MYNFFIWSCSTIIVKLLCDVCFQKMQDGFDNMRYRKDMKRNKTKQVSLNKVIIVWERKRERKEWEIDKLSENGGNIIRKQIILFWKYATCRKRKGVTLRFLLLVYWKNDVWTYNIPFHCHIRGLESFSNMKCLSKTMKQFTNKLPYTFSNPFLLTDWKTVHFCQYMIPTVKCFKVFSH